MTSEFSASPSPSFCDLLWEILPVPVTLRALMLVTDTNHECVLCRPSSMVECTVLAVIQLKGFVLCCGVVCAAGLDTVLIQWELSWREVNHHQLKG